MLSCYPLYYYLSFSSGRCRTQAEDAGERHKIQHKADKRQSDHGLGAGAFDDLPDQPEHEHCSEAVTREHDAAQAGRQLQGLAGQGEAARIDRGQAEPQPNHCYPQ